MTTEDRPIRRVITIDGPAGTGKSTAAKAVAASIGFAYLDSGALYRAIALASERVGIARPDDPRVASLLQRLEIRARPTVAGFRIFIEDEEVTEPLRGQSIGQLASCLATDARVRERVGRILRELAGNHDCVAEGRDMGSAIFPEAVLKIFLTASLDTRTQRRLHELLGRGVATGVETIRCEIRERDERDRSRCVSPLRVPADAILIDNAELTPEEQVRVIVDLYRGEGRPRGSMFHRLVKNTVGFLFRRLLRVKVIGEERVPKGACLIACNHRSSLDPPLVGSLAPGAIAIMAKEELFGVPLLGWLIRRLNAIPIRRGRFDRRGIREAIRRLRRGMPLLIFPEGTRARGPELRRPRAGVGLLARATGVPVVPARIWGSDHPAGALVGRQKIRLVFGSPLEPPASGRGADAEFAAAVMDAIRALSFPDD